MWRGWRSDKKRKGRFLNPWKENYQTLEDQKIKIKTKLRKRPSKYQQHNQWANNLIRNNLFYIHNNYNDEAIQTFIGLLGKQKKYQKCLSNIFWE